MFCRDGVLELPVPERCSESVGYSQTHCLLIVIGTQNDANGRGNHGATCEWIWGGWADNAGCIDNVGDFNRNVVGVHHKLPRTAQPTLGWS